MYLEEQQYFIILFPILRKYLLDLLVVLQLTISLFRNIGKVSLGFDWGVGGGSNSIIKNPH